MGENDQHAKDQLRRRFRAIRGGLAADAVPALSAAACARALTLPAFRLARHVIVYSPIGNEVDPAALADAAVAAGRALYYPRSCGAEIEFVHSTPSALVPGPRGAMEPAASEPLAPGTDEVCVFVPGLAFDRQGGRLGRGLGCYDRALARHPNAAKIGLAYDVQLVDAVPVDPWDVPMQAVVTEADIYLVGHPDGALALKENRP